MTRALILQLFMHFTNSEKTIYPGRTTQSVYGRLLLNYDMKQNHVRSWTIKDQIMNEYT